MLIRVTPSILDGISSFYTERLTYAIICLTSELLIWEQNQHPSIRHTKIVYVTYVRNVEFLFIATYVENILGFSL